MQRNRSSSIALCAYVVVQAAAVPFMLSQAAAAASPEVSGQNLTIEQAVQYAFARNPQIKAAEARLGEVGGRLTTAQTYPFNPVLSGGAASRKGGGQSSADYEVSLSQRIQLAGQRNHRIDAASADLAAERKNLRRTKRLLAASVHLAFVAALEARDLLEISRRDADLASRLHELAQRRLARGAGTQLDVNVAAAERGRAELRYQAANVAYQTQRAVLAEAMGADPTSSPTPQGELRGSLEPLPPLDQVISAARERRADLLALGELEAASEARYQLERAEAWPDFTLRAFGGREEGSDTIIGGGISVPIPLLNRNQGRIQEARAAAQRALATRQSGELSVGRQVVVAHARYDAGLRSSQRLRDLVLGTLEQNLELLQRSFEAGKATWPEVVVIRRSLVDARRELTVAEANVRRAWIELRVAAGRMPVPEQTSRRSENR